MRTRRAGFESACSPSRRRVPRCSPRSPARPRSRSSTCPRRSAASSPSRSSARPRCRRGTTRRWTGTRSGPPTRRGATEDAPVRLEVIGEVARRPSARRRGPPRHARSASRPAPRSRRGADAVVPVELTTPLDATRNRLVRAAATPPARCPAAILVHAAVETGGSIRRAGSDLALGATILEAGPVADRRGDRPRGRRRRAAAVAFTAGRASPSSRPATRSCPPDAALGPAGIPDANGPGLAALVDAAGGEAHDARDRQGPARGRRVPAVRRAHRRRVDAIVVSGGVSVGPYDVVKLAFEKIGRIDLWRVAVQPGKPFAFGTAERPDGGRTLLFGLPGNPVSSFVTFELFVRPGDPRPRRPPARSPPAPGRSRRPRASPSRRATGRRGVRPGDRRARR